MRLSEAGALGDLIRRRYPFSYLRKEAGGWCGCFIGGAVLATGTEESALASSFRTYEAFPWLRESFGVESQIGMMFIEVCAGLVSFDELVAYVRSIEPDCDCNRFNCNCKATAPEVQAEYVTQA